MPPDDQSSYLAPVPEAIRRQSELADQIARDAGISNVPAARATTVVETESLPATSDQEAQPAQELAQAAQGAQQPELPLGDAPATPPETQQPDWQQRFASLQGKYNSEVPELHAQVRSMERIIAGMQSNAQAHEQTRQETRAPTPAPFAELEIDPADKEAYGEELITKAQRWAEAKLAPRFAQLESRLASYEGRTQQIAQQSAATTVEGQLDRSLPNWRDINIDPSFNAWLGQADPFSGLSRKQLITDAHVSGDAPRTLAFFQAYLREQTAVNPGHGTQPVQTAPATTPVAPAADRLPLESLAAPGRGVATPAAPGAPTARIWTQAQIQQLYREKVRGQWNGREADFLRLEQDISAAAREGRYQQ